MLCRFSLVIIWICVSANTANAMFVAQNLARSLQRARTFGACTAIATAATAGFGSGKKNDVCEMLKAENPNFDVYFAYAQTHGFNPNTQFVDEYLPIVVAAYSDNLSALNRLIEEGGDVNVQDAHGTTPLLWAVYRDNVTMVEHLLKNPDLDVNLADHEGSTPLMAAAQNLSFSHHKNTEEIIKALIGHPKIDVNKTKSKDSDECFLNRIINPVFPFGTGDIELDRRKRVLNFVLERRDLDRSVVKYHFPWFKEEFEQFFTARNARSNE